jgi:hypothetical protein
MAGQDVDPADGQGRLFLESDPDGLANIFRNYSKRIIQRYSKSINVRPDNT